jgi:hypothetical protein
MSKKLRCPKTRVLFQFLQNTGKNGFVQSTDWGFEIKRETETVTAPRWAEVKVVGKDVKAVKPGDFILIEPMMWTLSFEFEKEKYWATAEEKLIAVSAERPTGIV